MNFSEWLKRNKSEQNAGMEEAWDAAISSAMEQMCRGCNGLACYERPTCKRYNNVKKLIDDGYMQ